MKKYVSAITQSDIRLEIETAASVLEQDGQIAFPDGNARNGFIEDCVLSQIDGIELYDSDPFRSEKDYTIDVLDMAAFYGYTL